jgi:hypothetical protein
MDILRTQSRLRQLWCRIRPNLSLDLRLWTSKRQITVEGKLDPEISRMR